MRIKILPADKYFSLCIRERSGWTCEYCNKYYPEGNRQGLHCSHLFGRGNYSIRFDIYNAFAHCFFCHNQLGSNPVIFSDWANNKLGENIIQSLIEKRNDTNKAKFIKKNINEVSKFYRLQHERMINQRMNNEKIILENYDGYDQFNI